MTNDTESVQQLIAEFRKISAKDSISPESLGYLLQRIADKDTSVLQEVIANSNRVVELVADMQVKVNSSLDTARSAMSKAEGSENKANEAANNAINAIDTSNKAIEKAQSALEKAIEALAQAIESADIAQDAAAISSIAREGSTARFSEIVPDIVMAETQGSISPNGRVVYMSARKIFAYKVGDVFYLAWNNQQYPQQMYNESISQIRKDKIFICEDKAYIWSEQDKDLVEISDSKADKSMFRTLSETEYESLSRKDEDTYYFIYE